MWDIISALAVWATAAIAAERIVEIWIHGDIFMERRQALGRWYTSNTDSKARWFFFKVLTCAWCFSVWVSLLCSMTLPGYWFRYQATDNIIIKWFALVGLTNFWHAIARMPLLVEMKMFGGKVDTHATVSVSSMIEQDDDV